MRAIQRIKQLVRSSPFNWPIRRGAIYEAYLRIFYPEHIRLRQKELAFYETLAGSLTGQLVFDVGANHGDKSDIFLRSGARVVCVEPDQACCELLKHRFGHLIPGRVRIERCALSDRDGRLPMYIESPGSPFNSFARHWVDERVARTGRRVDSTIVTVKKAQTLFDLYGVPRLMKIDVEGHEPEVLSGVQSMVPVITFEVNLPAFREQALRSVDLIASLSPQTVFNYFESCQDGFVCEAFVDAQKMKSIILTTEKPYFEVACRCLP